MKDCTRHKYEIPVKHLTILDQYRQLTGKFIKGIIYEACHLCGNVTGGL